MELFNFVEIITTIKSTITNCSKQISALYLQHYIIYIQGVPKTREFSIVIPNSKSHYIIMSARVYLMKTVRL